MTLSKQAAILLESIKYGLLVPEDIVNWSDSVIIGMEKPPSWIIELSTLRGVTVDDYAAGLREHAESLLFIRDQVQLVVSACQTDLLSFQNALQNLFRITISETQLRQLDALEERLKDLLVEWDQQEDPDVIKPPLRKKFGEVFQEYLSTAPEVPSFVHKFLRRDNASNDPRKRAEEIQEAIRRILLRHWDPIGVSRIKEAQDEYDSYFGAVYRLLLYKASDEELMEFLYTTETQTMGLSGFGSRSRLKNVVAQLRQIDVKL